MLHVPICFTDNDDNETAEELCKPIKKRPLAEARQASFQLEQDRKFEHMISVLKEQHDCQQQLEVDPDVDAFVTGIAFSLQKSSSMRSFLPRLDHLSMIHCILTESLHQGHILLHKGQNQT